MAGIAVDVLTEQENELYGTDGDSVAGRVSDSALVVPCGLHSFWFID